MDNQVKGLLQKINLIETDMELHRQILVSIPSGQKKEMEKTAALIAEMKDQIKDLRDQIRSADENEYNRLVAIERAAQTFKNLSINKNFVRVDTLNETGECFVTLNDGTRLDCLVAAQEDKGNWILLTLDGEVKEYPGGLIK